MLNRFQVCILNLPFIKINQIQTFKSKAGGVFSFLRIRIDVCLTAKREITKKIMSKKKRRNALKVDVSTKTGLSESIENSEIREKTDKTAASRKNKTTGIIGKLKLSYLKQHWVAVGIIVFLSLGAFGAGLKYLEDDAKRVMTERSTASRLNPVNEGFLSKINPFLSAPMPSPTPQLSKEYLYAGGSRLLAVEDANASAVPPADLAIWRPSTGVWWVLGGTGSQQTSQGWGTSGDIAAPGDYDGDGKTDFCVFRPSDSTWYVMRSSDGGAEYYLFGASGDIPVPADYDGDGRTDAAVFRPSTGVWYIWNRATSQVDSVQFGQSGDKPAVGDYDGDGKADLAVWRESGTPTFYVLRSSDASLQYQAYGLAGDVPAVADYDGDGRADYSVRRGNSWYVLKSSDAQTLSYSWGLSTDTEVPNDYDGDGKADIAVWRGSTGVWYILNSADSSTRIVQWGMAGDIPVPAIYRR